MWSRSATQLLPPSLILLLLSSLVENGAGTGWTVKQKLSYYSNIVVNKPYSMRETLLIGSNCSSLLLTVEKLLLTWRQFAWIKRLNPNFIYQRLNVGHLISYFTICSLNKGSLASPLVDRQPSTKEFKGRGVMTMNKNILSENKEVFYQWLVGFTDGDGTFSIVRQNDKWSLTFKISQSTYNLRVLHFIKSQLKAGSIYVEKDGDHAHFRIRDCRVLESVIFPIFDKYSLLTTKQFNFGKFKEAHSILSDSSLSRLDKDTFIFKILETKPPVNYISPAWSLVENKVSNFKTASKIMSKAWLAGFTEADGSFYLAAKSSTNLVHAFEITQKLDPLVLIAIKHILGISTSVKVSNSGYYSIVTTNSRGIENIIKYYKNTMKGMKSLEFRIWARSYVKHKGDFVALNKIRNQIRKMKTK